MSDASRDERSNADAGGSRARLLRAAAPLLVVAVALTLNLAGNARTGLWDRDEPRFAAAVREMRARGDWLLPTFNGAPRYHKPILVYWIMRAAYEVGGDNPFGARLTSACAGTLACLTLWALGRRMFDARVGLTAALMLASAPIVVAESKLATTDALLMLWVVLAIWAYFELIRLRARG
ncbi:MAG: glycosyltransferase family 39 protein, partial [Planctomycetota bacterium]|nr:glycosyltransferase family 39 protein [Planctomycetota bacterium]